MLKLMLKKTEIGTLTVNNKTVSRQLYFIHLEPGVTI